MKSMVNTKQMLAMLVFVTLIFLGCQKEVITPTPPPVKPAEVTLSLAAAPILQSDLITVEYGGTASITAYSNQDSKITSSSDPNKIEKSPATFILSDLTTDRKVTITAQTNAGMKSQEVTIKVTPPDPNTLMAIGEWKKIKKFAWDTTATDPTFAWRDNRINPNGPCPTIWVLSKDKKFSTPVSKECNPNYIQGTAYWKIETLPNGELQLTTGGGIAIVTKLTSTHLEIYTKVTEAERKVGFKDDLTIFEKIK